MPCLHVHAFEAKPNEMHCIELDRSSRKPSRMTLLPLNPLIRRIKGDHATVIKLLSKEPLRSRKALILLSFSAFVSHSHSFFILSHRLSEAVIPLKTGAFFYVFLVLQCLSLLVLQKVLQNGLYNSEKRLCGVAS